MIEGAGRRRESGARHALYLVGPRPLRARSSQVVDCAMAGIDHVLDQEDFDATYAWMSTLRRGHGRQLGWSVAGLFGDDKIAEAMSHAGTRNAAYAPYGYGQNRGFPFPALVKARKLHQQKTTLFRLFFPCEQVKLRVKRPTWLHVWKACDAAYVRYRKNYGSDNHTFIEGAYVKGNTLYARLGS